jgi:hypothetical protein
MDGVRMTTEKIPTEDRGPGFYKLDGILLHGPNFVLNANYELRREHKDSYTYPVDGWIWFDSEEEAIAHFAST